MFTYEATLPDVVFLYPYMINMMIREQRQEYHHDHFLLKHQHLESYYLLSKYSHLNQLAKSECVFSPIA